jgi:CubicO group peptidase (beta-lactamase class C family)
MRQTLSVTTFATFSLYFISILFSYQAVSQPIYYPGAGWEAKSPDKLGLKPALIDSAVALALRAENTVERDLRIANLKAYAREPDYTILGPMKERGGPAGMIIKDGYIAAQWGDIERVDMTFSVTKSYLSTVAGLAVDHGFIKDVDDPVGRYVWDGTYDGAHNGKVTWKHLLQQTSDWSGCQFGTCDWADRPPKEGTIDDWKNRTMLDPGSTFEYNDTRVNLLAYSLLQVFRKPLPVILKENIMDPIGASTTWRWYGYDDAFVNIDGMMMQTVSGGGHFGGGLFINTLDHARFGLLFARKGKWNDRQLISSSWIAEARQPSAANPSYGYLWWTNADNRFPGASKDVFSAIGFGGNYIVIDQAHDLVIVTRWMDDEKISDVVGLVIKAINSKE